MNCGGGHDEIEDTQVDGPSPVEEIPDESQLPDTLIEDEIPGPDAERVRDECKEGVIESIEGQVVNVLAPCSEILDMTKSLTAKACSKS